MSEKPHSTAKHPADKHEDKPPVATKKSDTVDDHAEIDGKQVDINQAQKEAAAKATESQPSDVTPEGQREITDFAVPGESYPVKIFTEAVPTGEAPSEYVISVPPEEGSKKKAREVARISFRTAATAEKKEQDGVTVESLIAIVIDRLKSYQAVPGTRSVEDARAIRGLDDAQDALRQRKAERLRLGIAGTAAIKLDSQREPTMPIGIVIPAPVQAKN